MPDELRGGLEGGMPQVDMDLGGTGGSRNAGNASGTTHDTGSVGEDGKGHGTANEAKADAEEIFDANRHRSQGEVKQFARDEADVATQPGSPDGGQNRHQQIDAPADRPGSTTG